MENRIIKQYLTNSIFRMIFLHMSSPVRTHVSTRVKCFDIFGVFSVCVSSSVGKLMLCCCVLVSQLRLKSKKHLDQQQKNAAEHQATTCNLLFSSLNKVHPTNLVPSLKLYYSGMFATYAMRGESLSAQGQLLLWICAIQNDYLAWFYLILIY